MGGFSILRELAQFKERERCHERRREFVSDGYDIFYLLVLLFSLYFVPQDVNNIYQIKNINNVTQFIIHSPAAEYEL